MDQCNTKCATCIALEKFPVLEKCIYIDKLSGKDFNRPQYQKLLKKCGPATATRYVDLMLQKIQKGEFDATDIITHTLSLEEGSHAYSIFDKKEDNCIKVILKP